jgi:hypothetical protein
MSSNKHNIVLHLEKTVFNKDDSSPIRQSFYDLQSKVCLGFKIIQDKNVDTNSNYKHHHKMVHTKDGDFVILKQSKMTNLERIKKSMMLLELSLLLDLFKKHLDNFYVQKWNFQDNCIHFLYNKICGYRLNEDTRWDNCDKDGFCFARSLGEFNSSDYLKNHVRSALDIHVDVDGWNLVEYYQTHRLSYPLFFNENKQNLLNLMNYMKLLRLGCKDGYSVDLLQKQLQYNLRHNPKFLLKTFDFLHLLFNVLTVNNYSKLKYKTKLELLKSEISMENNSLISEILDLNDKILEQDYSFLDVLSKHLLEESNSLYWLDNYHINSGW